MQRLTLIALLFVIAVANGGCATHYVTPAAGISIAELGDEDLQSYYQRYPASAFPANIAIIRVQDSGYVTKTNRAYGHGRYSIVTTRDIESDEAFEKIANMPLVHSIAPIRRLLLPANAGSIKDLRVSAAKLRADMVLIYTVDTTFTVAGRSLGPLSTISLGLIPNKKAHVTTTVAGALVDVRTGFIYGTTEATAREEQRATIWSTNMAIESSRLRAEKRAFGSFVAEFQDLWGDVLNTHAATHSNVPMPIRDRDSYYRVQFDQK